MGCFHHGQNRTKCGHVKIFIFLDEIKIARANFIFNFDPYFQLQLWLQSKKCIPPARKLGNCQSFQNIVEIYLLGL